MFLHDKISTKLHLFEHIANNGYKKNMYLAARKRSMNNKLQGQKRIMENASYRISYLETGLKEITSICEKNTNALDLYIVQHNLTKKRKLRKKK
jgi:predicted RNA-binding protein associated with RNAse of E/G family